jgi:hypothetical protein
MREIDFTVTKIDLGEMKMEKEVLIIAKQGMFSAGGTVLKTEGVFNSEDQFEETGAGQTSHVDHANVFYQIPSDENGLPIVFLHGYGQSRMGWTTTPDGREGWSNLFLRKGHSVYLIDQPRRGEAGQTSVSGIISDKTLDQRWYVNFRMGRWENEKAVLNKNSQFPDDEYSIDQFFRQMTPDTGMKSDRGLDFDKEVVAKALAATVDEVYKRTGKKSILISHSQGGSPGWLAPVYTKNIKAIVAIEPGGPAAENSIEYKELLAQKIPIAFYFGDYIENGDPKILSTPIWQERLEKCKKFVKNYNDEGGNSVLVELPKEGIFGNDHFIFQNLNNDIVADHVENWIKGL